MNNNLFNPYFLLYITPFSLGQHFMKSERIGLDNPFYETPIHKAYAVIKLEKTMYLADYLLHKFRDKLNKEKEVFLKLLSQLFILKKLLLIF